MSGPGGGFGCKEAGGPGPNSGLIFLGFPFSIMPHFLFLRQFYLFLFFLCFQVPKISIKSYKIKQTKLKLNILIYKFNHIILMKILIKT